jgi:hypothetical protein
MDIALSPKTKLFIFVLFIGFVLSFLFYLIDGPIRYAVLAIAFILYALLARIAEKLRKKQMF